MDPQTYLLVILVCFTMVFCDGVEGGRWNISAKEDLEFERQLKFLNKPSIKTINTDFGDTFDCVDFYKQPAFDYALMNNYTIEYEQKPVSLQNKLRDPLYIREEGEECPIGSVPIKRITKTDLIREKLASEEGSHVGNTLGVHYAVVRTKPSINKFVGAGSTGSIWNPEVSGREYSAARLKISNQGDSIEVGWRVDSTLYGDTRTRLYVRTDAGRSHCFDTRCGFVIVDSSLRVGNALKPSKHGGPIYEVTLFIVQNTITGNWYLEYGKDHKQIGFWPKSLFTGLAKLGDSAEWGGEVFSPPGTLKPVMGGGSISSSPEIDYVAYFRSMALMDGQNTINVDSLDSIADNNNYQVKDVGITNDPLWGHLMFYGGNSSPST